MHRTHCLQTQVLFPVCGKALLDYTLDFLVSNGFDHIFIISCDVNHTKRITEHLKKEKWTTRATPHITIYSWAACASDGDVLRELFDKRIIQDDFLLMRGDTISNIKLAPVIEARKKMSNSHSMMTMILARSHPEDVDQKADSFLRCSVAYDPDAMELLEYSTRSLEIRASHLEKYESLEILSNVIDTRMCMCSPGVLEVFKDDFDFQDIQNHFINSVLQVGILDRRIHIHLADRSFVRAGIASGCLERYLQVHREVLQSWSHPFVPSHLHGITNGLVTDLRSSYGATFVGSNVKLGKRCSLLNSVIWDDVKIGDDVQMENCLVCRGCVIADGVVLGSGCIVGTDVVLGPRASLQHGQRVFCPREMKFPHDDDDDDDDENSESEVEEDAAEKRAAAGDNDDNDDRSGLEIEVKGQCREDMDCVVGHGGVGRLFVVTEGEGYRVSSLRWNDSSSELGDEEILEKEEIVEEEMDIEWIERQIVETVKRDLQDGAGAHNTLREVNGLKFANNVPLDDTAWFVFEGMLEYVWERKKGCGLQDMFNFFGKLIEEYEELLSTYLSNDEDMMFLISCIGEAFHEKGGDVVVLFPAVLRALYDEDILTESGLLAWKKRGSEYVESANRFFEWLESEEDEDEEDEDGEDEDEGKD
jgi:translation initiation factor eIF-2B subunit epsilon